MCNSCAKQFCDKTCIPDVCVCVCVCEVILRKTKIFKRLCLLLEKKTEPTKVSTDKDDLLTKTVFQMCPQLFPSSDPRSLCHKLCQILPSPLPCKTHLKITSPCFEILQVIILISHLKALIDLASLDLAASLIFAVLAVLTES